MTVVSNEWMNFPFNNNLQVQFNVSNGSLLCSILIMWGPNPVHVTSCKDTTTSCKNTTQIDLTATKCSLFYSYFVREQQDEQRRHLAVLYWCECPCLCLLHAFHGVLMQPEYLSAKWATLGTSGKQWHSQPHVPDKQRW